MAKFRLSAGAEVDLLNKQELHDTLRDWDAEQIARGRGVKALRFIGTLGATAANGIGTIPNSPQSGYVWSVRNLGIVGSVATQWRIFTVFDNSNVPPAGNQGMMGFAASSTGAQVSWGAAQAWLYENEFVAIGTPNAQTGIGYLLQVLEAPAELAWKLSV